jgi:hypothetical protein
MNMASVLGIERIVGGILVQPNCKAFRIAYFTILVAGLVMTLMEPMGVCGQSKEKNIQFLEKGRDPFLLPAGVRLRSPEAGAPIRKEIVAPGEKEVGGMHTGKKGLTESRPLALKAILISDRIRLASIDRWIVTVGDTVYDEKILEIHPDRVVLEKGPKRRVLLLSQSPVRLFVEEKIAGE